MKLPKSLCWVVGSVALGITAVACGEGAGPVCTKEFRVFSVFVMDGTGTGILDLDYTVTISNLGRRVELDSTVLAAAVGDGWYPVMTDAQGSLLGQTGSLVRFEGTNGALTTRGDYLFVAGVCHVEKLSGPDTLVAQ